MQQEAERRDRLTVEEAVQLGAQLPMLVRGFYYEGWNPKGKPRKERHKEDFLAHIKDAFKEDYTSRPESIARAVFNTIARHASPGQSHAAKPRGVTATLKPPAVAGL